MTSFAVIFSAGHLAYDLAYREAKTKLPGGQFCFS
jgi:hypothetical protein